MKRLSAILLVGALVFGTVGCTNMNKTQQGLLSGAAGGAILGAGLGALTGGSGTTGQYHKRETESDPEISGDTDFDQSADDAAEDA